MKKAKSNLAHGVLCLGLVCAIEAMAAGPAATVGSLTSAGGSVLTGSPNVRIGGLPVARQGDTATCLFLGTPLPGSISQGSATVRINNLPAARVGSSVGGVPVACSIVSGNPTVLIGP